ncbi:MAG TPA: tripartite tricarboxylate transporter substrate binding protein [Burkholderiales bacterium]|nr:tripartite tricarboxylate transporter substrate binding protein [Burkholderiales bacterium]
MKLSAFLMTAALSASVSPCFAQAYPSKPIELVSPTGPGGGSDLVARMVADIIAKEKLLSQPIVVQNKAGGGGAVGQGYVAARKADPYIVLAAGATLVTVPIRTGLDVGLDKFQPLGVIGVDLNSLAVRDDAPYRNVKDFVAAAKAGPKPIVIGITFPGGSAHLLVYKLEQITGAKFTTVSFKSGSDAVAAVLGGHIHATTENLGEVMPHVESKKLRLLGVPALKRPVGLPNVPTLKEQGYDIHAGGFRGFASPAGIPREAFTLLESTIAKVHRSPQWVEYMARNMYEDLYMNGEETTRFLVANRAELARVFGEMGLLQKK